MHAVAGATDLYGGRWVFLVADDRPSVDDRLTRQALARLPWVTYQRTYDAPAVRRLGMPGVEPQAEVSVDSFRITPLPVAGARRIALIQARLARPVRLLAPLAGVRVVEPPYAAVPLREAMGWHPVHTHDAAQIRLRETAARVGRRLAVEPAGWAVARRPGTADVIHGTDGSRPRRGSRQHRSSGGTHEPAGCR